MVVRVTEPDGGFGLMELLVVVAILSILAIGTSSLAFRSGGPSAQAAGLLQSDARAARHFSMLTGLDHALVFGADGWDIARQSVDGWTVLSTQRPRDLQLSTDQDQWILPANGAVRGLSLRIETRGNVSQCASHASRILECK